MSESIELIVSQPKNELKCTIVTFSKNESSKKIVTV